MNTPVAAYEMIRGSDVDRDGMYLELVESSTRKVVAEVFYSDVTNAMTFTTFTQDLPLAAVEMLIECAKSDLPPITPVQP